MEESMDTKSLLTRMTVCKLTNHKWATITYPGSEGAGHFLRCRRCGKENHKGASVRPNIGPPAG